VIRAVPALPQCRARSCRRREPAHRAHRGHQRRRRRTRRAPLRRE
jgi:hypothetical protein